MSNPFHRKGHYSLSGLQVPQASTDLSEVSYVSTKVVNHTLAQTSEVQAEDRDYIHPSPGALLPKMTEVTLEDDDLTSFLDASVLAQFRQEDREARQAIKLQLGSFDEAALLAYVQQQDSWRQDTRVGVPYYIQAWRYRETPYAIVFRNDMLQTLNALWVISWAEGRHVLDVAQGLRQMSGT